MSKGLPPQILGRNGYCTFKTFSYLQDNLTGHSMLILNPESLNDISDMSKVELLHSLFPQPCGDGLCFL